MLKYAYQLGVEQAYREAGIDKSAMTTKIRAAELLAAGLKPWEVALAASKSVPRGIPKKLPLPPAGGPVISTGPRGGANPVLFQKLFGDLNLPAAARPGRMPSFATS